MEKLYNCNRTFDKEDCFRVCNSQNFSYQFENRIKYKLFCKCNYNNRIICNKNDIGIDAIILIICFSMFFITFLIFLTCFYNRKKYITEEIPPKYEEEIPPKYEE